MTLHVAVSGTRQPLKPYQEKWLETELNRLQFERSGITIHHGDCTGADAAAHTKAHEWLGWPVIIHPPLDESRRAFCEGASEIREAKEYHARDRALINECSLLLAIPGTPFSIDTIDTRGKAHIGGTWYTVLYALEQGTQTRICEVQ